jgi:hypothetical protein
MKRNETLCNSYSVSVQDIMNVCRGWGLLLLLLFLLRGGMAQGVPNAATIIDLLCVST